MIKVGTGKKSFYFRGCGWSKKDISWSKEDEKWIIAMHQLFQLMYGKDTPGYAFGKGKGACARIEETDDPRPLFQYDHDTWEANYEVFIGSLQTDAAKLCKSLKPQLDLCSQQSEAESVASASFTELPNNSPIPVSCAEVPTLSTDSSPTFSVLTSATAASNSSIIHVDLTVDFSNSREEEFDLLLCPLHMNQSHWGLIAIDLVGKKLLFDDGYKLQPDSSILPSMKYLLDVLHELRPNAQCFSISFWSESSCFVIL